MKLRYTGTAPVTFMQLGLELEPGAEFSVEDEQAPGYLARADIESLEPPQADPEPEEEPAAPKGKGKAPAATKPAAQAPDDMTQ